MQKVPYILVVGDKEKANGAVAVRARGNQDLGVMPLEDFAAKLADDIAPPLIRSDARGALLSCLRLRLPTGPLKGFDTIATFLTVALPTPSASTG